MENALTLFILAGSFLVFALAGLALSYARKITRGDSE